MEAYLQHGKTGSPMMTEQVEVKENPLWWHLKGLSYTATGYGSKIPSVYMVKYNGRWHRVYTMCYSNSGVDYIVSKNQRINVTLYNH